MGRPKKRSKEAILFPDEEQTQNCGKCGEHFDTLAELRTHKMAAHSESIYSHLLIQLSYYWWSKILILLAFSSLSCLLVLLTGRPNHPYFCEHCDYTAMFDCDMKRHQLVHSASKQFSCDICDFSTNWERNLNLHMTNVHSNKEPWKCDRCDVKIYNHSKVGVSTWSLYVALVSWE